MRLLNRIFGKKKNQTNIADSTLIETHVCPNCWGYQRYDDQFVEHNSGQTKSNFKSFNQKKKTFIQKFVEKYITGIFG